MTDATSNLVPEFMWRFSNQLSEFDNKVDRLIDDVHDLEVRVTNVEEGLAAFNRGLDRLESRMGRVERRLELVDVY
jgi:exonuclease VII small subunit